MKIGDINIIVRQFTQLFPHADFRIDVRCCIDLITAARKIKKNYYDYCEYFHAW